MPDLVAQRHRAKRQSREGRQALPKAAPKGQLDGRETDAIMGTSPEALGGGGDQQVWMTDGAVVQAALAGQLLIHLKRSLPLLDADRAARQSIKLAAQSSELGRVAGAIQQLEPDHVADRDLPIDGVFVKRGAQLAPNDAGPHPRAGVGQLHLPELSWAAELLQNVWGEIGELSLGELPASGTINDGPQRGVDGICRSFSAEHISRRIGKLRVEVDVRAPDLGFAHVTLKIHLPGGRGYTSACRGSSSETSACRLEARSLERPDGGRLGLDTPRGSIVRRLAEPPGAYVQDLRRGSCARRKA